MFTFFFIVGSSFSSLCFLRCEQRKVDFYFAARRFPLKRCLTHPHPNPVTCTDGTDPEDAANVPPLNWPETDADWRATPDPLAVPSGPVPTTHQLQANTLRHINACGIVREFDHKTFSSAWQHNFYFVSCFICCELPPPSCLSFATRHVNVLLAHSLSFLVLSLWGASLWTVTVDQSSHNNRRQSQTNHHTRAAAVEMRQQLEGQDRMGWVWLSARLSEAVGWLLTTETRKRATKLKRSEPVCHFLNVFIYFGYREK